MPVYVIRAGDTDMVKIGWAENPESRRHDLQTGHYEKLHVIRVIAGPRALEGWLHRHFRSHRVRREWHRLQPEMLTVTVDDVRPQRRHKLSEERRAKIAASMSKSWRDGNLRQTFNMQHPAA